MASIVKRGSSYSVVYMTLIQGRRKQKWETYHSLDEAEQRKRILDLCQKIETRRSEHIDTVGDLMERYILLYGQIKWSLSTFQSNCGLIRNYIQPWLGMIRLHELSPRMVAELYQDILRRPYSGPYRNSHRKTIGPAILKSIHKLLHSAFEQAVLWEYVPRNPFHRAAMPNTFRQNYQFLLAEQIAALLQQCKEPWLSLAINLAFAGTFRKGEVLALTWQDIDWDNRSIRISKTIKRVSREALQALNYQDVLYEFPSVLSSRKTTLVLKTPKTTSSIREVYLPETLMTILYEFYQSRKRVNTLSVFPDLIFCYEDGRPIQETTLTKHFHIALERAGLPRVPFHSLRHSSITYKLALSDGDIKAVQGDSGHAQADMITERYGHILEENRRNVSRRFEELFYQKADC